MSSKSRDPHGSSVVPIWSPAWRRYPRPSLLASTYNLPSWADSFTSTDSRTFCQGNSSHRFSYCLTFARDVPTGGLGKTSLAETFAFPAAEPLSGFPDPSAAPVVLCRTGFRCGPESRATSSSPTCCRPLLRMPLEVRLASRSARSLPACSPVACRGCSRVWLWDSVRLPPQRTCLSGRIARNRIPHRTPSCAFHVSGAGGHYEAPSCKRFDWFRPMAGRHRRSQCAVLPQS